MAAAQTGEIARAEVSQHKSILWPEIEAGDDLGRRPIGVARANGAPSLRGLASLTKELL
jgi:hypothetical protein